MRVKLVMFTESGERRDFDLIGSRAVIGRSTESTFQIPLAEVSRKHCELLIEDDELFVRDMGSTNGTYVNNRRVQQFELHVGDTLTVGPVIFTIVIDGRPTDIKPLRTILQPSGKVDDNALNDSRIMAAAADSQASSTMDILLDDHDRDHSHDDNPLAELEALARQKKS